ncbi:MAG TPA: glycosyltransferase family 39 protein [Blastocatellia bacterium]|nr:glycosyltransferase family 39 protein [Blastocatellia bacterium]
MMERRKKLTANLDLTLLATVVAGFSAVAAQRLGSVPVPDTGDEAMILQVPYEILYRGKFAWPMYRYLGGNIEDAWHSFRPVYYWLMTGFFKLFGWGLAQGRAFNLLAAAGSLVILYFIGRRLFGWPSGLMAVLMVAADPNFVERSRMVRNECVAMLFVLLGYYLYEIAEARKQARYCVGAGLAAGAAVMCHTNAVYILAAIGLLIVIRRGWRFYASGAIYQFLGGALAVMAYEIVYDLVGYATVRQQYHGDKAHFGLLEADGVLSNLVNEQARYRVWYSGGELSIDVPLILLHLFQLLLVVALVYLAIAGVRGWRRGDWINDARVRVLIVTVLAMLFIALVTGAKRKYVIYMPYLTPWFGLCVGILLRDGWSRIRQWQFAEAATTKTAQRLATIGLVLVVSVYGLLLVRQEAKFVAGVRNPNLASFDEMRLALRDVVPEGVCPVSVMYPVMWLAFPEADRCYASMERRMADLIDIDGKDYALILPADQHPVWLKDADENYHLLGEIQNTPYGDFRIYYTGTEARYRELAPKRYRFFGKRRGHVNLTAPAELRDQSLP